MRFVADESCDFGVVRALRAAGHDVFAVAEGDPRAEDSTVIDRAVSEDRLLLTEDKDFGQLVYAAGRRSAGVILIRFPARARAVLERAVVELVRRPEEQLRGRFIVLQPGRIRFGRARA